MLLVKGDGNLWQTEGLGWTVSAVCKSCTCHTFRWRSSCEKVQKSTKGLSRWLNSSCCLQGMYSARWRPNPVKEDGNLRPNDVVSCLQGMHLPYVDINLFSGGKYCTHDTIGYYTCTRRTSIWRKRSDDQSRWKNTEIYDRLRSLVK